VSSDPDNYPFQHSIFGTPHYTITFQNAADGQLNFERDSFEIPIRNRVGPAMAIAVLSISMSILSSGRSLANCS
jgi:hypothetical protein